MERETALGFPAHSTWLRAALSHSTLLMALSLSKGTAEWAARLS
jgi:hypothetical protein